MLNSATVENFRSRFQNDDELMHFGIMGMHWGIRRFQPYGQGYDAEHEGREVGLAARMGGGHGSFSSTYGRGAKKSLGDAVRSLGKKAGRSVNEGLERLNYANDRLGEGLKNVGKKAKSGLAKYASTHMSDSGYLYPDRDAQRIYESAGLGALGKAVASRFAQNSKITAKSAYELGGTIRKGLKDPEIRSDVSDAVKHAFSDKVQSVKVNSKEFGRNAASAAALFGGSFQNRNSARQQITDQYGAGSQPKTAYGRRNDYDEFAPGGKYHDIAVDTRDWNSRLSNTGQSNASLIRSAGRSILPGVSSTMRTAPINQTSTAPRWKGNDGMNTEARKRFATGELSELDSRSPVRLRGSTLTGLATKPYKDYNKTHPDYWRDLQEDHMDYRDRVKPSRFTRDKLTSKIGNMTTEKFNKELEKRGISFAMINQTPVPMIPKGQNNASIRELEKRLGLI